MNTNKYSLAATVAELVEGVEIEVATSALRIVMMELIQNQALVDQRLIDAMVMAEGGVKH